MTRIPGEWVLGGRPSSSQAASEVELRLPRPEPEGVEWRHEFFVGYWHPDRAVRVLVGVPEGIACQRVVGPNWVVVGSRAGAGVELRA